MPPLILVIPSGSSSFFCGGASQGQFTEIITRLVHGRLPRPGAPVSTPLNWSEVRKGLDPTKFNIKTIFRRLDKVGDLGRPVLGEGVDLAKVVARLAARASCYSGSAVAVISAFFIAAITCFSMACRSFLSVFSLAHTFSKPVPNFSPSKE